MKMFYKQVKVPMPHCGECKEKLRGDGSLAYPYECECGIWKINLVTGEYELIFDKDKHDI